MRIDTRWDSGMEHSKTVLRTTGDVLLCACPLGQVGLET